MRGRIALIKERIRLEDTSRPIVGQKKVGIVQAVSGVLEILALMCEEVRQSISTGEFQIPMAAASDRVKKSESEEVSKEYTVTIREDRTLTKMLKGGAYNWVNENIHAMLSDTQELVTVHFNRIIMAEEAVAEIRSLGLEPATIRQLLAFGEKHLNLQFPVVALGTSVMSARGKCLVPWLGKGGEQRFLGLLVHDERRYEPRFRFLAYRSTVAPGNP